MNKVISESLIQKRKGDDVESNMTGTQHVRTYEGSGKKESGRNLTMQVTQVRILYFILCAMKSSEKLNELPKVLQLINSTCLTLLYRFPMKLQNWMRAHVYQTAPGGGNGNPLQYSCLENSMDRGAWQAQSMQSQRVGHN